ncbi:MAG: hypothetical protein RBT41_05565, partial [Clostridia bacterium]|nr:hypothetical protein [Clostridia bacterium]
MLSSVWSFFMPLCVAFLAAYTLTGVFFPDKRIRNDLEKAREVLMTAEEAEGAKENKAGRYIVVFLSKVHKLIDLENLILADLRNMLNLMGSRGKPEKELAGYILKALWTALPLLAVPFVTGFAGYVALYPLFVLILTYQQVLSLRKKYKKWQLEIIKDLPELIDKLRISFASGRDYVSAFNQAGENSGPRMRLIIGKLLNDLQYMRPAPALDLFAQSFKMPVVTKFASAVKIAVEYGYEAAENYFRIIETDITEVRRVAIEELTRSKPEKVYQLYLVLFSLAVGSLALKGWEIFSRINQI